MDGLRYLGYTLENMFQIGFGEARFHRNGLPQSRQVFGFWDFDGAESAHIVVDELRVQEFEITLPQNADRVHEKPLWRRCSRGET